MEIHRSARRHGVSDAAIRHALGHPIVVVDLDPDSDPPKQLAIGPDNVGNLLEVIFSCWPTTGFWRSMPCRFARLSTTCSRVEATPMAERTQPYKTKTDRVLTDADIEAMADEAERGYDVETRKTRRRGRPMLGTAPAEVVPVRLDPDLKQAVEARAEAEHTTTSAIIREALRRFLDVA